MQPNIFEKRLNVTPSQFAAVADRRFADAQALCDTGENARANGAQYLAGVVIEILLKAQLMRAYSSVALKRSRTVEKDEFGIWSLVWRSHDLAGMLAQLPVVQAAIKTRGIQDGQPYLAWLVAICGTRTIYARYTPMTSTIKDAELMVERVRKLKELLK